MRKEIRIAGIAAGAAAALACNAARAATIVLYDQDFENPANFSNDGGDVNISTSVNDNYGGQPAGFSFAQAHTVETLNLTGSARGGGTAAFGTGWTDASGQGGNFAIGMLSGFQNDLLGLSFNVGNLPFFNVAIDITSIDLSTFSGPFVNDGDIPVFRFTLFDNLSGANTTGSGAILDQFDLTGTASPRHLTDWTSAVIALSTAGNTSGNVTFQIDLLQGGYAAFDNLLITASTEAGNVGEVPVPAALPLFLGGLAGFGFICGRRGRA